MAGNSGLVYWDTCIFYALLKREANHGNGILQGIEDEYEAFRSGRIHLATSTITVAEVAEGHFESTNDFQEFKNLRYTSSIEFYPPIFTIVELASEIKNYYFNNPLGERGQFKHLDLGDAIHLATAIRCEAAKFVTLDGKNKAKTESIGLLKLGPVVAEKYPLNITRPDPPQQSRLDFQNGGNEH